VALSKHEEHCDVGIEGHTTEKKSENKGTEREELEGMCEGELLWFFLQISELYPIFCVGSLGKSSGPSYSWCSQSEVDC